MARLHDLTVERTDAVDRPATGRRWILAKADEPSERLRDAAAAALDAVAKSGVALTDEARAAFEALADALGVTFEQAKTVSAEDDAGAQADEQTDTGEEDVADRGDDGDLARRVDEIAAEVAKLADAVHALAVAKTAGRGRSNQPAEPGREVRKGEGLFENIVFGPVAKLN